MARKKSHQEKSIEAEIANCSDPKKLKKLQDKLGRASSDADEREATRIANSRKAAQKRKGVTHRDQYLGKQSKWLPRRSSDTPPPQERSDWRRCNPNIFVRKPGQGLTGGEWTTCPQCGGTGWVRVR